AASLRAGTMTATWGALRPGSQLPTGTAASTLRWRTARAISQVTRRSQKMESASSIGVPTVTPRPTLRLQPLGRQRAHRRCRASRPPGHRPVEQPAREAATQARTGDTVQAVFLAVQDGLGRLEPAAHRGADALGHT